MASMKGDGSNGMIMDKNARKGYIRKKKRMALGPSRMKVEIKYLRAFTKTEN